MESIVITPESTAAASPDDESLAKAGEAAVELGNTHNSGQHIKPDWVPEKFWNPSTGEVNAEGLAKSYSELEKKVSKPAESPETPEAKPTGSLKIESVADAQKLATEKGIDFNALSTEYNTNGDLSDETYKSLEGKGIPKDVVQQFVEGQKAQLEQQRQEVLKDVGGEEKYAEMVTWAKGNMAEADIAAYNKAMATGDFGIIKLAISALQSKYVSANGQPPKTQVTGKGATGESLAPFQSRTQYVDAIKDARYERDPAYRAQVMKRLEVSNVF